MQPKFYRVVECQSQVEKFIFYYLVVLNWSTLLLLSSNVLLGKIKIEITKGAKYYTFDHRIVNYKYKIFNTKRAF